MVVVKGCYGGGVVSFEFVMVVEVGYGGGKWWLEVATWRKKRGKRIKWFFDFFVNFGKNDLIEILTMGLTYIGDVVSLGPIGVGHVALDL
jgi:hypothetical protein